MYWDRQACEDGEREVLMFPLPVDDDIFRNTRLSFRTNGRQLDHIATPDFHLALLLNIRVYLSGRVMSRGPAQLVRPLARLCWTSAGPALSNAVAGPSSLRPYSRPLSTSSARQSRPNPKHAAGTSATMVKPPHRITHRIVQLVDATTNTLTDPQPLHSIRFDKTTHELRLVSDSPPVVKLISLADEAEKAKALEVKLKLNRKTAFEDKEVQISWNSADGDLRHKLDIARGFLERGDRVHMVFAPKGTGAGVPEISQVRKEEILSYFEHGMEDLGMRWRDELKTKTSVVVYWQASSAVRQEKKLKVNEAELSKRKIKDEKKEQRRLKEEERKRKAAEKA